MALPLPPELFLEIRDRFEEWDLRTHVCYYLTHPSIAAIYDTAEDPDAFWALLCWHCGIGSLPTERQVRWKDIATRSVLSDGFCKHPQCGEALLEYNRKRMLEVTEEVQPCQPLVIRDYEHEAVPESHSIFSHIRFRRYGDLFHAQNVLKDAHLTYPSGSDAPKSRTVTDIWGTYNVEPPDDYPGMYLAEHPMVQRSFATFAPVTSMLMLNLCGHTVRGRLLMGGRALTVVDILNAMHPELDHVLNMDEVREYVDLHAQCFPKDWDYRAAFRTLRTIRSCLNVCPLERLEHQENTEFGPAFSFVQA
ncbi:hypothetical protein L226DRAFT_489219 [Lentinus tigrinus ALCF2SS1-7]|uniref:Uncharacterized protein n=1 Tax=Lentinus tigrinus ALCF2SS1-6 TaxID=1328759 RepID=A0A5C2S5K5_9APHY|nr:hypothetical protein L227DRAFT_549800 [Lentinus tigrinus ALCF2SS1-6]RPD73376.1 hypothetical protein L226DRAFT_489219 [Lentinus tigrinus ALCF2SS1-7]